MKTAANIVAILLGVIFILFGLNFWLHFIPIPHSDVDTAKNAFVGEMYKSGYLSLVKALEVIGGLLLVLPRVRNWGLVIIGAIVFNIACIQYFLTKDGLKDPVVIFAILACFFLAYVGRQGFCCLACCGSGCCGANCCKSSAEGAGSCCASESSSGCCGEKK